AGWVSGTPGASTSAAILDESTLRKSAVGMPAALAPATLCGASSNATTSAPPASSALALTRPEPPRPNTATFCPAKVVTGITAHIPLPLVGRGQGWGSGGAVANVDDCAPPRDPPPRRPPQGGREQRAAPLSANGLASQ